MDDLRKEFDAWMTKDDDECCDVNQEPKQEEEYADYIVELTTIMLVPQRCGIFFSKKDLRAVGLTSELSISLKQRIRMITDLLKSIFSHDEMKKMFDSFHIIIDERIATYEELSSEYPHTKELFQTHIVKAKSLKKRLNRILVESNPDSL
jgi:hypothetical protein